MVAASGADLRVWQDAGAVVVFVDEERRDRVVSDGRPADLQLVTVRTASGDETRFDELAFGAPLEESAIARPDPDDPVTILYTSGTTGRPKGALGTHRGAIANLWNMAFGAARESLIAGRRPDPSVQPASLSAAPLFHIGGVAAIIGSPIGGSKIVLMRRWDVEEGLRLAGREHLTGLGGVPAIARQILEHPGVEQLGLEIRTFPLVAPPCPRIFPSARCRCSARTCSSSTATG